MGRIPLIALAAVFVVAHSAQAATVSIVPQEGTKRGNLFLSRGQGYAPIVTVTKAHTGDAVMASGTGRAFVIYEDGCKVEVSAETAVVSVQETSPCKAALIPEMSRGIGVGKYVVGAALVGGAVAAVALLGGGGGDEKGSNKDPRDPDRPDSPASP
jgi:hypothetical protein